VDLFLFILGFIATIVLGGIGIYLTIKGLRKNQIHFVNKEVISLFHGDLQQFKDIKINYKNQPIGNGLLTLRGSFFLSSKKDLTSSDIYDKLTLKLPSGYSYKYIDLVKKSSRLKIKVQSSDDEAIFTWDIFKNNEFFHFESLVEFKNDIEENNNTWQIQNKLNSGLEVYHRIKDVESFQKDKKIEKPNSLKSYILNLLLLLLFATGLIYSAYDNHYGNKESIVANVSYNDQLSDMVINLKKGELDIYGRTRDSTSLKEIENLKLVGKPKILDSNHSVIHSILPLLVGLVLIASFFVFLYFIIVERYNYSQFRIYIKEFNDPKSSVKKVNHVPF